MMTMMIVQEEMPAVTSCVMIVKGIRRKKSFKNWISYEVYRIYVMYACCNLDFELIENKFFTRCSLLITFFLLKKVNAKPIVWVKRRGFFYNDDIIVVVIVTPYFFPPVQSHTTIVTLRGGGG